MKLDEIGVWSEIKLDIIKDYANAYTRIMKAQQWCKGYVYIDAFAGAGKHISKTTGELIEGSPLNALNITPQFTEYHFIDLNEERADNFSEIAKDYENVYPYHGDCNKIHAKDIFPALNFNSFKRALCLLDPYGLHLNWDIIYTAGQMKSIEIFLNFPIMDMNMNVLKSDPGKVDPLQAARMTAFWGDESWHDIAYDTTGNLFGIEEKTGNEAVTEAFR